MTVDARRDEVDEIDPEHFEAAMGMCQARAEAADQGEDDDD